MRAGRSIHKELLPLALAVSLGPMGHGQKSATAAPASSGAAEYVPTMTFDVASVRESKPDYEHGFSVGGNFEGNSSSLRLSNFDLPNLLTMAYGLSHYQIEGVPDSLNREMFNVQAKADAAADEKLTALTDKQRGLERRHMVQTLLAERFRLKTHWETRQNSVYNLVVAKSASKLHTEGSLPPSPDELKNFGDRPVPPIYQRGNGDPGYEYVGHGCPMETLAAVLGMNMGAAVADKTGLSGKYDFLLRYHGTRPTKENEDPSMWPALIDAVPDQLGLKLEPAKGPVNMLVIDHIELPSEN